MKKLILIFSVVFLCINLNASANVATDYNFTQFVATYNPITGDTVAKSTHTSIDPFQLNDVTYGSFALPFTFIFDCRDYFSIFINSNGFLTFGPTAPGVSNYAPIVSSETYEGTISALGMDLIGVFGTTIDFSGVTNVLTDVKNFKGVVVGRHITAATGIPANTFITAMDTTLKTITISNNTTDIIVNDLVVQIASGSIVRSTVGPIGNRIHTIQWTNFRQYIIIGTDDNFNFQIKLYEATGAIQIVYGNMYKNTIPVAAVFGQVGLRGMNSTEFNNRTNSGLWGSSTAGPNNASTSQLTNTISPVSGQTYQWIPNANCVLPVEMSSFISLVNIRDVTLNWTTTSETNNSGFDIERSAVKGEWSKIGSVAGNGTTLLAVNYSFTDRNLNTGRYSYRLKQIDFNGNFKYYTLNNEVNVGIPARFELLQNYPNPFNPSTKISYDLPFDGKVTLKIFDLSGKEVSTLVNEVQTAGYYTVTFNGAGLSSGIYFYRLNSEENVAFTATKKMILIK